METKVIWLLGGIYVFLQNAIAIAFLTAMPMVAAKDLIIIAGARQHGIQEFFYKFAPSLEINTTRADSLREWSWPVLQEEDFGVLMSERTAAANVSRYNIFDFLFERKNDSVIQNILTGAIRNSWENATRGIILGEERFGKIGENPYTSDDAIKTIYRLIENLSIRAKDVTLVLVYDTPRIDQWASIWREQSNSEEYLDFLCTSKESDVRFEYTDTIMNPLKLATVYRKHGWKVVILDEEGIRLSGLDPSHAIGCNILGVSCDEGWITGLKEEISRLPPSYNIDDLNETDKHELEELLLLRDCSYENNLEFQNEQFQIVKKQSIWKNCKKQFNYELRENISDVNFFLNAMQSQKGCEREFVNLSGILESTATSKFQFLLLSIIVASCFFIMTIAGILLIRSEHGKNLRKEFDGLFHGSITRKSDSTNPQPAAFNQHSKLLCNACKFVRFDPNCIFCQNGRRLSSSEIGREVERRIKQQQKTSASTIEDEGKDDDDTGLCISDISPSLLTEGSKTRSELTPSPADNDIAPSITMDLNNTWASKSSTYESFSMAHYSDTSDFDMNLRSTKSQSKKKKRRKVGVTQKDKSQVVRKLKELLVLKAESGEKVYKLTEPSNSFSPDDNLQTISFEDDDKRFV